MIWNTSIVHLTLGIPFCWRLGKGGKASETKPPDLHAALAAGVGAGGGRRGICGLQRGRDDDLGERVLSHPHVLQGDFLQRKPRTVGGVPRRDCLLLAEKPAG